MPDAPNASTATSALLTSAKNDLQCATSKMATHRCESAMRASMPAFVFIFGTAAAALHYFAVANEIRLGAALMVLFAYLYYFTSFWLVL